MKSTLGLLMLFLFFEGCIPLIGGNRNNASKSIIITSNNHYESCDTINIGDYFLIDSVFVCQLDTLKTNNQVFILKIKNTTLDTLIITKTITDEGGTYFLNTLNEPVALVYDHEMQFYVMYITSNYYGAFARKIIFFFKDENNNQKSTVINVRGFVKN
jgi:hypothetical protein